jgi:hypothetical protein
MLHMHMLHMHMRMHMSCTCHARAMHVPGRATGRHDPRPHLRRSDGEQEAAPWLRRLLGRHARDAGMCMIMTVASPWHHHITTMIVPSPCHHHAITTPSPQHHHGRHRVVEAEVWPSAWAASLGEIPARSGICRPERWWWPRSCSISTTTTRRRSLQPANCIPMHPACSPLSPTAPRAPPPPPPPPRHPRLTLVRCMTSGLKK